jgi:voltage-gated potassium channel Kch
MVVGLLGLLTVLLTDTGILALHDRAAASAAFFEATRVVTTVGPVNLVNGAGYVWWSSFAMLVTLAFTAAFTAGLVEYFASPRLVSLVGRRTLPRRGHVIVVGLGQVGLRLCQELRGLGIAVVAVERHASAPAVRIARTRKIPVLIADGEDRAVLEQLRLRHARALVAASSDEMDNVAVAVAARAVAPGGRVVLRAGNHELISETRSLLPLGTTRDVTAMAAAWMSAHLLGQRPTGVCADADHVWVEVPGAGFRLWPQSTRAGCCHPASSVGLDHSG